MQDASAEERELVTKLTRDTAAVAGEVGRSESLEERIRATLHAAALDEQTAAELAAGRLVREREAVGLFGAASFESGPAGRTVRREAGTAVPAKRERDDGRSLKVAERRRRVERELAAASAEEQKARREHAGAAKATERARKQARAAQRRAEEANERAEDARNSLREAERREKDAARSHDRAARAVASLEKKLE